MIELIVVVEVLILVLSWDLLSHSKYLYGTYFHRSKFHPGSLVKETLFFFFFDSSTSSLLDFSLKSFPLLFLSPFNPVNLQGFLCTFLEIESKHIQIPHVHVKTMYLCNTSPVQSQKSHRWYVYCM